MGSNTEIRGVAETIGIITGPTGCEQGPPPAPFFGANVRPGDNEPEPASVQSGEGMKSTGIDVRANIVAASKSPVRSYGYNARYDC